MKCPKCNQEISYVVVYTDAMRKGFLEGTSNRIGVYGTATVLETITRILCSRCGEDIRFFVDERGYLKEEKH